jgi:hypothetical protein
MPPVSRPYVVGFSPKRAADGVERRESSRVKFVQFRSNPVSD